MRVIRSNLDGSKIEDLVDTGKGDERPGRNESKWCVRVTVDADRGHMSGTKKARTMPAWGAYFERMWKSQRVRMR